MSKYYSKNREVRFATTSEFKEMVKNAKLKTTVLNSEVFWLLLVIAEALNIDTEEV
jgi:hypothetical protein